jgi:cysteine synthase A
MKMFESRKLEDRSQKMEGTCQLACPTTVVRRACKQGQSFNHSIIQSTNLPDCRQSRQVNQSFNQQTNQPTNHSFIQSLNHSTMKIKSSTQLIGNTPHLRLSKLFPNHDVWIKLERANPGGSIKDRIALAMINDAEAKGLLEPGGTIVEPTSGNTGIGLALVGAVKGYRVILVMPESMSVERRMLLKAYGAEIVLTSKEKGMRGAIEKAMEIVNNTPGAFMPMQFENLANPEAHMRTTAMEIINDFPEGIDYLITGIGTGGHITGVGKKLKEAFPQVSVIGVEPSASAVISGGAPAPHPLQGIGAGFIPPILALDILDEVIQIQGDEAYAITRQLARTEGVLAGISTGASLAAIAKKLAFIPYDKTILTFAYDTGERYLSVDGLWE